MSTDGLGRARGRAANNESERHDAHAHRLLAQCARSLKSRSRVDHEMNTAKRGAMLHAFTAQRQRHRKTYLVIFDLAAQKLTRVFSKSARACLHSAQCVCGESTLSKRANSDNSNGMTEVLNPSRTRSRMYVILLVWTTHAFERVVCDEAGLVWNERARQKSPFCSSKRTCRTVGRPPRRLKSTGLFC